ncbi:MAG: hypothetical protein K2L13_04265 [Opitutales bacterium]|nr:hypothetical protein [Opitutales bacterium]
MNSKPMDVIGQSSANGGTPEAGNMKTSLHWYRMHRLPSDEIRKKKLNDMFARLETEDIKALKKDNADSEIIPHNILTQLISDCEQQVTQGNDDSNNDIQLALDDLNREIDKFSYAREVWRDLCLAIGKFFAYCFPPPFFKAINNWLCKISEIGIRRTIRRPLFDKTLQLIEQFYRLNPQTPNQTRSMQLLYLLSSIDPSETREQLQSNKDFASLFISVPKNGSAWDAYKDFRRKLDDDLYNAYTQIQSQNSNKIKLRVMNDNPNPTENNLMMLLMLCSNLSRGQALPGAIDRGPEMVPASESPFIIYDQGRTLLELAVNTSWAFRFCIAGKYIIQNNVITLNRNEEFIENLDGFDYKDVPHKEENNEWHEGEHYVSKDGTLHAAIKRDREVITLEDARKLGMVTPTVMQDLSLEENITNIRPLYIIFRSARNFRDTLSSAKNIIDCLPKSIENADILARAAIEQVRKKNESNKGKPYYAPLVPVFLGFSMGGMEAQAISKRHGFASISFNSLGLGDAVRDYAKPVKEEIKDESTIPASFDKFVTAYAKFIDAISHQGFIMPKDWVADVDDHLTAEIFTGKPQAGQTYRLDLPADTKKKNFVRRHAGYVEATRETVERLETISQPENQS